MPFIAVITFLVMVSAAVLKNPAAFQNSRHYNTAPMPTIVQSEPSVTETTTPSPAIIQATSQHETLIDCIGPDGKHLQVTQKQCDDFNAAWRKGNQQNVTNTDNQVQNTQPSNNLVSCPNGYGAYFNTTSDGCTSYWQQQGQYLQQWTKDQVQQSNQRIQAIQNQTPQIQTPQQNVQNPSSQNSYQVVQPTLPPIPHCPISASGQVMRDISGSCNPN